MKLSLVSHVLASAVVLLAACSVPSTSSDPGQGSAARADGDRDRSGTDTSSSSDPSGYTGKDAARLEVRLVDAPSDEVTSIVVTVASVDVSVNGAWVTVTDAEHTIDLLTLQGGAFLDLGAASLPPGRVEQVRLRLAEGGDHHVVTVAGEKQALTVPSGEQSGIKLVGSFDLAPCSTARLTIDFDGKRSLHMIGGSAAGSAPERDAGARDAAAPTKPSGGGAPSTWLMRPVIRMKALVAAGTCEEPVQETDAGEPLPDTCADVACSEQEICRDGACQAIAAE